MSEAKWIVKSSGRIIGPMTIEDIVEAMRTKVFSVLDEVREPRSRWTFIREHQLLMPVVRQIRDEQASVMENTQSTFVTSNKTMTSSVTERLVEEQDKTPEPGPGPVQGMKSVTGVEKNVATPLTGNKSFGVLSDKKVQQEIQKQATRWKQIVLAIGVVALVGAGLLWRMQTGATMSAATAAELMKGAQTQAGLGNFAVALRTVREVEKARGLQSADRILKLKLLLSSDETNSLDLSRALDEVTLGGQEASPVSLELLKGLVAFRSGKTAEALTRFQEATSRNPKVEEAFLNLASAHYLNKSLSMAWQTLRDLKVVRNIAYAQVVRGLVALGWPNDTGAERIVKTAFDEYTAMESEVDQHVSQKGLAGRMADSSLSTVRELRFERLLIGSLLAKRVGDVAWQDQFRRKLSQTSPFESDRYFRSPLLDWQLIRWSQPMRTLCEQFAQSFPDDALTKGVVALCAAASGDWINSRTVIDSAIRQYQGNSTLAAVNALLLLNSKRESEAERIVQMYGDSDRTLIYWVRAELLMKKHDQAGAERAWARVRQFDPQEPRAYYGLAVAASELGNDSSRVENLSNGAKYGANYIPILNLSGRVHEF